jgi:hypothetical protein
MCVRESGGGYFFYCWFIRSLVCFAVMLCVCVCVCVLRRAVVVNTNISTSISHVLYMKH